MNTCPPAVVLCNGAELKGKLRRICEGTHPVRLEYRTIPGHEAPNVKVSLPDFVRRASYLPPRILDLLEIASYVFCADRCVSRGRKDALEYHSWARSFHFVIRVRDFEFWTQPTVGQKLANALRFMSGDREYTFAFQPGHSTPPTSLFDHPEFMLDTSNRTRIMLFSGGLDSLAGVLDSLETSTDQVCLVSHRSYPGIIRTQDRLFEALRRDYGTRVRHFTFHCSLLGNSASEESQRTRAFLYTAIAYSLSYALGQSEFFVHENGITALNFPRRQSLINARASRTTHPQTIANLEAFFSELGGPGKAPVRIRTPFFWKTKADLFRMISCYGREDLITSTVSCSRTRGKSGPATHCGVCSQCIDRRFAAYASGLHDVDDGGIYSVDFIRDRIEEPEARTALVDYVRQARDFAKWSIDDFYTEMLSELAHVHGHIPELTEEETVERVWDLCRRHGEHVLDAMKTMREVHDDPYSEVVPGSLLDLIARREYLKTPIMRLAAAVCNQLKKAIPLAFQHSRPINEQDFNDKVNAILISQGEDYRREHPVLSFGLAHTIPDHSLGDYDLLIECKYVRGHTSPSKVSDGIAADITKYPRDSFLLFIVYDPDRCIPDDDQFKAAFEGTGRCTVCVIR